MNEWRNLVNEKHTNTSIRFQEIIAKINVAMASLEQKLTKVNKKILLIFNVQKLFTLIQVF